MQIKIFLIVLFALAFCPAFGQNCNLPGKWVNEQGSVLQIDSVDQAYHIYGHYASSTGVDGKIFPLKGWMNISAGQSIAVSFSVHWGEYGSITSWTGYVEATDDGCEIYTLWHLVRPGADEVWERILTRSSTFSKLVP